ncbi:MAG: hypothetical protein PHF88_02920 [Candidatus Pacebacteria bacterium]|jgi:hypothetical protein|nr:hypothetical protein [Candidatus Paceibacterota bacterium]
MLQKIIKLFQPNSNKDDTYEFIWGVISSNDVTGSKEANLNTLNNIDIIYNKKEKTYSISVETIYQFRNGKNGERLYIKNLFNKLTEWMIHKGYDITKEVKLSDVFTEGQNINTEFEDIDRTLVASAMS